MTFPTIRERLKQIQEYGLPHRVMAGNSLAGLFQHEVVGHLDEIVPEVCLNNWSGHFPNLEDLGRYYSEIFSRATGEKFSKDYFIKIIPPIATLSTQLDISLLETHAFYDPKSDMTHYFILPSRKIL